MWLPTGRAAVVRVAVLPLTATVTGLPASMTKSTEPVTTPAPKPLIVAVKVTDSPKSDGLVLLVSAVVVVAWATLSEPAV